MFADRVGGTLWGCWFWEGFLWFRCAGLSFPVRTRGVAHAVRLCPRARGHFVLLLIRGDVSRHIGVLAYTPLWPLPERFFGSQPASPRRKPLCSGVFRSCLLWGAAYAGQS